jgi:hypothetical protein
VLIGHDEGATFAAGVAANAIAKEKLAGLIMIAGPGRSYGKILRDQPKNDSPRPGTVPEQRSTTMYQSSTVSPIYDPSPARNIASIASEKDRPERPAICAARQEPGLLFPRVH